MRNQETTIKVLESVKGGGLLGVTSLEVTNATGIANNRATAALTRLTVLGCVKREKVFGSSCRFRYYYVRPLEAPTARPRVEHKPTTGIEAAMLRMSEPPPKPRTRWGVDASGVSIRLAISPRGSIAVTPEQARKVYKQLRMIFGE